MIQLIQRPKLEEVTEEEYKLYNDETDPLAYSDYIKEPYYKEGCGILWQSEHYNDPPAGYRYYKKVGIEYLILCGSEDMKLVQKMIDMFDSNLQNNEQYRQSSRRKGKGVCEVKQRGLNKSTFNNGSTDRGCR